MEDHLRELEAVLQAALQRFLISARSQVQRSTEALAEERDAMLAEVEGKRAELDAENYRHGQGSSEPGEQGGVEYRRHQLHHFGVDVAQQARYDAGRDVLWALPVDSRR